MREKKTYSIFKSNGQKEYKYNVQLYYDGWYCGFGKFCRTDEELEEYIKDIEEVGYIKEGDGKDEK